MLPVRTATQFRPRFWPWRCARRLFRKRCGARRAVRHRNKRMIGAQRLGIGHIQPRGQNRTVAQASTSASVSTTGPREALIRIAVGFIRASSSAPIRWCVSLVSVQCNEMKSDSRNRCLRGTNVAPIRPQPVHRDRDRRRECASGIRSRGGRIPGRSAQIRPRRSSPRSVPGRAAM